MVVQETQAGYALDDTLCLTFVARRGCVDGTGSAQFGVGAAVSRHTDSTFPHTPPRTELAPCYQIFPTNL